MKITEAVKRACEEPTLLDALTWIAVWESERAIEQAHAYKMTGVSTGAQGGWDTCFKVCFSLVMEEWSKNGAVNGPQGFQGPQELQGPQGLQGPQRLQGLQGLLGAK